MDRVARGAAAPRARRAGRRPARARARGAVPSVPAVAGATPVAAGARRMAHGVALLGDLPFMVDGDSADVWARQDQFRLDASVGAPPDAFSATGQDWGMPVYRWDVIAREDFRWLRERGAAQRRSLRRLPRRSSRRLLSDVRLAQRRRRAVLHTGRRARPDRARRARPDHLPRSRVPTSSPRISASSRISSARRWRGSASPDFACSGGNATGTPRDSRFAIRPSIPPLSVADIRHARHRNDGRLVGGTTDRGTSADCGAPDRPADDGGRRRFDWRASTVRPSATCCSRRCSRPAPTCRCCRCRTCSAGAIASTSPRPSTIAIGRSGCPGLSIALTRCRKPANGRRCLRAWSEKHGRI